MKLIQPTRLLALLRQVLSDTHSDWHKNFSLDDADALASSLGIEWKLAKNAEEKRDLALALKPETCASIGNGLTDLELMKVVKLRIVTLQAEGVHVQTLLNSDIVIPSINDALDLFIDEQRLIATLRR